MDEVVKLFLEESVALELNIGDLYQLFSVKFPVDHEFWWKISIEEMNHAAIIESINDLFLNESILPPEFIEKQTEDLRGMNLYLLDKIEQFKIDPPSRLSALKFASELENSIGESHFEIFMTAKPNSTLVKVLQKLNGDDINHAKRVESYIRENGIF
jgi:hypothetical protein